MLSVIKDIYARWRLRSIRNETERQPDWDSLNRLALILHKSSSVNKSQIDKFIQETGKYVEVYYVETDARKPTFADWHCLTREYRTMMDAPSGKLLKELGAQKFDLVINAGPDRYSALLSASINAPVHCSVTGRYSEANLVITGTNGLEEYLSQAIRYLKMIRPRQL